MDFSLLNDSEMDDSDMDDNEMEDSEMDDVQSDRLQHVFQPMTLSKPITLTDDSHKPRRGTGRVLPTVFTASSTPLELFTEINPRAPGVTPIMGKR
jgi:uncharacterized protein involved in copper resistance